jgi:putative RNA 2'-phosphotransferase
MDERARTSVSKFLAFVLRHRPDAIGIQLDRQGWVEVDDLLRQCHTHGRRISRQALDEVVATNPKRRFAVSEDGLRIRASQGHSTEVDLGYQPAEPPEVLFHGTVAPSLASIRSRGLERMQRHHVHLSADAGTARTVGARRGRPVVLRIFAGRMHRDGHAFLLSANGVWLTDAVPSAYIEFPDPGTA